MIGYGSITDSIYKLEVHILNYSNEDYLHLNMKKGDKIEIVGIIETNGKYIFIVTFYILTYLFIYIPFTYIYLHIYFIFYIFQLTHRI